MEQAGRDPFRSGDNTEADAEPAYAHDPRWLLVERILATDDFKRSPRLSDFLRRICELTLEDREGTISEQYLGEELFGRPQEYDSSADTIVRSHALRLRRRLDQYFLRAGKSESLRLVIPRGAYVPVFVPASAASPTIGPKEPVSSLEPATSAESSLSVDPAGIQAQVAEATASISAPTPFTALSGGINRGTVIGRYRVALAVLLSLSLTLLVAVVVMWASLRSVHTKAQTNRNHPLWGKLFTSEEPTRIVLGDSGLVLFHATAHRYVSLQDYVNDDLSKQMSYVQHVDHDFARFLSGRRYTSMVDATTAVRLLHMPEATPDRTLIGYSRDMRLDDFKDGNLIMIGAQEADPWVELFEHSMDFVFSIDTPDHHSQFLNRHPLSGELASYSPAPTGMPKLYAVIAFLPNLNANGNVLLLEGITMAGTEAAVDLVMDDQRLLPILRKIRRPDGSLPHFEMLIASDNVKDSPAPAQVIALHIHST